MLSRTKQNEIYARECVLAGMMLTDELMEDINRQPLCNSEEWARNEANGFATGTVWLQS